MSDESNDSKECVVIKDDMIELILIKNTNCSMREAINRAVEKLLEA